ncbi:permease of the major facilitator superfamily protein [Agrilactobacillus composti DSM 18527 = JCM 14202]|uniref:Permease of the major facilitator superfamily protein n=1 Tax=Agrilactobacillus composti DSM 18527 = JCM 14202 TaxID=1423734 RepID=X0PD17_9LACO|nr:MFS transporter [Agrilactobacillus composti]KRM33060.1 permease of the major facilitator superfamily protein [Agrilactobacillus composti DSM 18527 = JCM 14202]GAF38593.1 permease [Agrilactobacillus composti DSM 18527 = JCM 14202]
MASKTKGLSLKWLLLGSLVTNTGISFIWPLTTIYMHEYLHESLTAAGIVLFINSIVMIIGNYVGGFLFDRWQPYRTILVGITINVISSIILIFFHGWPSYAIFLIILSFGNGIVGTTINAFATLVESRPASYVFNVLYFMSNLGLVIGTLIVGFVLPYGIQWIFALAALLFVIFLGVAAVFYRVTTTKKRTKRTKGSEQLAPANAHKILGLLAVFVISWIVYEQWQSNISAFMVSHGMSVKDYTFVWTFNAIVIVLFQPLLAHFDRWLSDHMMLRLNVGFLLFGGSFGILLLASQYWHFLLAMGVLTLGEILAFPGVSTYVDGLVLDSQRGQFQGIVSGTASFGRAVGPLIGAQVIERSSYHLLFLGCIIGLMIFLAGFNLLNRRITAHQ